MNTIPPMFSETHDTATHRRSQVAARIGRFIFADLMVTLILAPLAYGAVEAWSVALFELNALLLAVLLALKFVLRPDAKFRFHYVLLPPAALLLLGVAQLIPVDWPTASLDPAATRQAVVKLLALWIYLVVALNALKSRERWRALLSVIVWLGFALAFFGIIQKLTWNGNLYWVRPISSGVPFGPFVNYNHFAGLMEMLFALAAGCLLFGGVSREKRGVMTFAVLMMATSIVVSLSRGGLLALGVEIIVFGVIAALLRKRWRAAVVPGAIVALALGVIALLALWISYDQIAARWKNLSGDGGELSVAGRLEAWRNSWRLFRDHPLTGAGLGTFPTGYPAYGSSSAYRERLEQAHNDYLQLLTDGGIAGGAIGLWFLVALLLLARRQWKKLRAAEKGSLEHGLIIGSLVAILGLLIHSFTDFNLQVTSNALYFMVMIAIAASFETHQ